MVPESARHQRRMALGDNDDNALLDNALGDVQDGKKNRGLRVELDKLSLFIQ